MANITNQHIYTESRKMVLMNPSAGHNGDEDIENKLCTQQDKERVE